MVAAIRAAAARDDAEFAVQPLRDPMVEDLRTQAQRLEAQKRYATRPPRSTRRSRWCRRIRHCCRNAPKPRCCCATTRPPSASRATPMPSARRSDRCAAATGRPSSRRDCVAGDAAGAASAQGAGRGLQGQRPEPVLRWSNSSSAAARRWPRAARSRSAFPASFRARRSSAWPKRSRTRSSARRAAGRSRHRHRQDLRLPRAGVAVGHEDDHLHRHQRAAGPALPPRPAAGARCARHRPVDRAAEGPRQLPVPLPAGAGQGRAAAFVHPRAGRRSSSASSPGAGARAWATSPNSRRCPRIRRCCRW